MIDDDSDHDCEIYVDVTELVVLDLRTGIQRVVRELVEHGVAGATRCRVVPVVAVGRKFHRLSKAGWQRIRSPGRGIGERRITHERGVHPFIRTMKRLARFNASLYNRLQQIYIGHKVRRQSRGLYLDRPVHIGPRATLVLLDSFWGGGSTLAAARAAKRLGTTIVLVVYDLIPMSHPQFCDARLVQKFRPLMTQAAKISDRALAISQDCADTFAKTFPGKSVSAFPLGHDLRDEEIEATSAWPDPLWGGEGMVFLMVGSIEPRKGHRTVLDAFERRWTQGLSDKLLVIGKVGWDVDDLMERLDHHSEAGRKLFVVHNATDTMLREALLRADAAIIASFIEGFGLPLAESLAAGLPVLASDIPVFHEIAGDSAVYFKAGDAAALDEAINVLHSSFAEQVRRARDFRWPDWHEAATRFFAQVDR